MSTLEFNYLIGNHSGSLKSFAYNFTKNVEDAEDLLQDTLVKAIRYKDNFQDGTNFKGWLFTIMRNIFINNYKRKKLQKTRKKNAVEMSGYEYDIIMKRTLIRPLPSCLTNLERLFSSS